MAWKNIIFSYHAQEIHRKNTNKPVFISTIFLYGFSHQSHVFYLYTSLLYIHKYIKIYVNICKYIKIFFRNVVFVFVFSPEYLICNGQNLTSISWHFQWAALKQPWKGPKFWFPKSTLAAISLINLLKI